ncbi:hypothetical protein Naga_101872g2, partial [Nannochloropsis gaditana]
MARENELNKIPTDHTFGPTKAPIISKRECSSISHQWIEIPVIAKQTSIPGAIFWSHFPVDLSIHRSRGSLFGSLIYRPVCHCSSFFVIFLVSGHRLPELPLLPSWFPFPSLR